VRKCSELQLPVSCGILRIPTDTAVPEFLDIAFSYAIVSIKRSRMSPASILAPFCLPQIFHLTFYDCRGFVFPSFEGYPG
jgi:hypothetical protein